MTAATEKQRAGEFIVSEGNGTFSREVGTLADQTEPFLDGTLLMEDSSELVEWDGSTAAIVGILIGYHDTAGKTAQQRAGVYIARRAEVKGSLLQYGSNDNEVIAAAVSQLAAKNIIVREPLEEGTDVTEPATSEATSEGTAT